jgi:gas vesicle protein
MNGSIWLMLGTAAGAIVALLLAPSSGQARRAALRAAVRVEPYVELQRLHAEWQARMAETQDPCGRR